MGFEDRQPLKDKLLWLDLETTGSEVEHDCIIEVGCMLTTHDLIEIDTFTSVVKPEAAGLGRLFMNPIVKEMHTVNGLIDDILAVDTKPVHLVTKSLLEWLAESGAEQGKTVLAGSGVGHFDRKFIDRYMPQLSKYLRYWCIDIGVIRRAHDMWVGTTVSTANDGKTHRSLDDVICHVEEARAFRVLWQANRV